MYITLSAQFVFSLSAIISSLSSSEDEGGQNAKFIIQMLGMVWVSSQVVYTANFYHTSSYRLKFWTRMAPY